jgi:hypothetical protein
MGSPSSDGVAVGDFAALNDGGSRALFIGRITAVTSTSITLSSTYHMGTEPADGMYELRVGGAWAGPSGADAFPFDFGSGNNALRNTSDHPARYNFKNDQTYAPYAAWTMAINFTTSQGYSTSYGDGGKALMQGPATGSTFNLLRAQGASSAFYDWKFDRNGDSGTTDLVQASQRRVNFWRCSFSNSTQWGMYAYGNHIISECEFYDNAEYGIRISGDGCLIRCIARDNGDSGFWSDGAMVVTFVNCVAVANGGDGFDIATESPVLINCHADDNTDNGVSVTGSSSPTPYIENSSFSDNGTRGIVVTGNYTFSGLFFNNGFGSGTEANASGDVSASHGIIESGKVTFPTDAATMTDPANGDYRIALDEAKNTGRGEYTQEQSGQSGAVGYPDIGACDADCTSGGGGIQIARGMHGGMRG